MNIRMPDMVSMYLEGAGRFDSLRHEDAKIKLNLENSRLHVRLVADTTPVRFIRLRWNFTSAEMPSEPVRITGDCWERGYGNLEWRGIVARRCMPWVCAASTGSDMALDDTGRITYCYGVRVRSGAMCFWQYDDTGVTLWLDVRCGGAGVKLGGRELNAAEVVMAEYKNIKAFDAMHAFYRTLCSDVLLPSKPVYGFNNWYYAYGNSSHSDIIRDTRWLSDLCRGINNRPFMVIDDGWQPNKTDWPWDRGNERFPDMKALADEIKALDVHPGLWVRYLANRQQKMPGVPEEAKMMRDHQFLDPSHPFVRDHVIDVTRRIVDWGYQLIKHDFSTFDMFGVWGLYRQDMLAEDGWHFYDQSRTSAEIIVDFYRVIREAAGEDTLILGCDVIGFLAAGLVHLNRTGYDTSGREWEGTRSAGVNTLAFHMTQEGTLYGADADCAPFTSKVPQKMALKWLDILAKSGTALFVSPEPGALDTEGQDALRAALARGSEQRDVLKPLDWMENTCPRVYDLNGTRVTYDWLEPQGVDSFRP